LYAVANRLAGSGGRDYFVRRRPLFGGTHRTTEPIQSTVAERLRPADTLPSESAASGAIYVPVYSTLFLGGPNRALTVNLAATVSVRNVSAVQLRSSGSAITTPSASTSVII